MPCLIELILGRQLPGNQVGNPLEFDAGVIEIGLRFGQLRLRHPQFLNASTQPAQGRQRRLRRLHLGNRVAQRQFVIASIQLGDRLLGLDGVALIHQQLGDASAHLESQIHLPRLHRAGQFDSLGIARVFCQGQRKPSQQRQNG
ncbi:MAG: hypothetical protein MZV65_14285 [Chromatiales bacterium]|nr:hypothetical protein [Chromatiales bacterium]